MTIQPGTTHELSEVVTSERTAEALGKPGVKVFGTPFLVALFEQVAGVLVERELPPGATTVGTMIDVKHLAATPVGMTVRAKATVLETDGRRFLFSVEAWDEREKVGEGRHERFVVQDLEKFLARVAKKTER